MKSNENLNEVAPWMYAISNTAVQSGQGLEIQRVLETGEYLVTSHH